MGVSTKGEREKRRDEAKAEMSTVAYGLIWLLYDGYEGRGKK